MNQPPWPESLPENIPYKEEIQAHLQSGAALLVPRQVDSTSTLLRALARAGAPHGLAVLADAQTAGRGRHGRTFLSPAGGIYLSLLLRPCLALQDAAPMTMAACVAVCRALERHCGLQGGIKWVNDIYYKGRKVCGILTEAAPGPQGNRVEHVVVGVGLNYTAPSGGFPPELADIAGSLYSPGETPPLSRGAMAAAIIDGLMALLPQPKAPDILAEYRRRSIVTGRRVLVLRGPSPRPAQALSILPDGSLQVQYEDGSLEALCSGEVSIRPC